MNVSVFFIFLVLVLVFSAIIATRAATRGGGGGLGPQQGCPQCGELNPVQAGFCRKCGRALR